MRMFIWYKWCDQEKIRKEAIRKKLEAKRLNINTFHLHVRRNIFIYVEGGKKWKEDHWVNGWYQEKRAINDRSRIGHPIIRKPTLSRNMLASWTQTRPYPTRSRQSRRARKIKLLQNQHSRPHDPSLTTWCNKILHKRCNKLQSAYFI